MQPLDGIHHISCITGDAPANVQFYTNVLGLRLIAKTVNQDDPGVYHLFYGSERAEPGTELTFFEYPGARRGRAGAGNVHRIAWRVADAAALAFWRARLSDHDVPVIDAAPAHDGADSFVFADPEGLHHELRIEPAHAHEAPLTAWHPDIAADHAIHGFAGVRMYSHAPEASAHKLRDVLGAVHDSEHDHWVLAGAARSSWVRIDPAPAAPPVNGAGVVHHVAFAMHDVDVSGWLERLSDAGEHHSGRVDRTYFESLYFREPGHVLYELATHGPGFTVDGPLETLGTRIILPPWLELHRTVIEAQLTALPDPRAGWPAPPAGIHDAPEVHA